MRQVNPAAVHIPAPAREALSEVLREGAQRLLTQAIEAEVTEWIDRHADVTDPRGRRQVVRNGHHPTRTLVTGVGPVEVKQPRILDRRVASVDDTGQWVDAQGIPCRDSAPRSCRLTCGEPKPSRS